VVEPAHSPALEERATRLRRRGVEVTFTDRPLHPEAVLDGRSLVVPSPGVPPHDPVLTLARSRDIEIISEPELAWRLSRGRTRVVGITGTNGKTTVTEMVAACLDATPAGNIGTPLTTVLCDRDAPDLVVAELSSFQLKWTSRLAPEVAVVLNLADDHRDWHGSFVAYAAAKAQIWAAQHDHQLALVPRDDVEAAGLFTAHPPPAAHATFGISGGVSGTSVVDGTVWWRDADDPSATAIPVVAVRDLARTNPHDLVNVCAAVTVAVTAGADPASLAPALRAFRPGPHRQQRVATIAGVDYVDDSKATNPHAAAAALVAFPSLVWIAGGLNKGLSFDALAPLLPGRVRAVVTIGSSGPALAAVARSAGVPVIEAGVLDDAVPAAAGLARPGETVLLAPACASMDQFADYADRGRAFRRAVAKLAGGVGGADGG
jgi:UDP-N-acetylmuramoylalanine--D-glutamate ligase